MCSVQIALCNCLVCVVDFLFKNFCGSIVSLGVHNVEVTAGSLGRVHLIIYSASGASATGHDRLTTQSELTLLFVPVSFAEMNKVYLLEHHFVYFHE